MDLGRVFGTCLSAIGGETNADIHWYRHERPTSITRKGFFEAAVWAIWVSGLKRRVAGPFLQRAERDGFDWDYRSVAAWDTYVLHNFARRIHPHLGPRSKAYQKWQAIHTIAHWLASYRTLREFRDDVFRGKERSADLNNTDVRALQARKLPWIGPANAQFIVRNMGGETIKCDRWVKAFLDYTGLSLPQLSARLRQLSIPLGLFDIVLWAYCEEFVSTVSRFDAHFDRLLAKRAFRAS